MTISEAKKVLGLKESDIIEKDKLEWGRDVTARQVAGEILPHYKERFKKELEAFNTLLEQGEYVKGENNNDN